MPGIVVALRQVGDAPRPLSVDADGLTHQADNALSGPPTLPMQRSTPLLSRAFLVAVSVLLLNDHYLKAAAPGVVTGKLSDLAGLFAFPLFLTALAPRYRSAAHWVTAAGFTWWKLPISQPFIDTWNAWAPVSVGRTIDPTDLIALVAVPLSYWYSARPRRQLSASVLRFAVAPLAAFAFAATTMLSVQPYERTYVFRTSPQELRQSLGALGIEEWAPSDSTLRISAPPDGIGELNVRIPTDCCGAVVAFLSVESDSIGAAATIRALRIGGTLVRGDSVRLIELFERCFVQRVDSVLTSGRAMREVSVRYPDRDRQPATWCQR